MDATGLQLVISAIGLAGAWVASYVASTRAVDKAIARLDKDNAVLANRMARAEQDIMSLRESRHHIAEVVDKLRLDVHAVQQRGRAP